MDSIISPLFFQVYAPIPGQERSFHRTLFVFCCKTHECYTCNNNRCIKGNIIASAVTSYSQQSRIDSSALFSLCPGRSSPAHVVSDLCSSQFSEVSYRGGMSSTPSTLHQVGQNVSPSVTACYQCRIYPLKVSGGDVFELIMVKYANY